MFDDIRFTLAFFVKYQIGYNIMFVNTVGAFLSGACSSPYPQTLD